MLVEVEEEVELEEDVELELDVDVELVVEELVDVLLDELVDVVVVVAFGLQTGFSGLANCGIAAASMQSVLNVDTQSTQSTRFCAVTIAPLQLPGGSANAVTSLQLPANPICETGMSSPPPHTLSAPPHALQIVETFFASAFWMAGTALPSPGSGHGFEWRPFRRASQHFWRAFEREFRNFVVDFPIDCWHLFVALFVPNSPEFRFA